MTALGWAISAGSLGTIAAAVWGYVQLKFRQGAERELKLQQAFATNLKKERDELQARTDEERVRLERVVTQLKREIVLLEEETVADFNPASVRERLQRLLEVPTKGGATASAVVVPAGPATGTR